MVKYKYVLLTAVVWGLIYITVKNAEQEKKVVCPHMAKPVNEVAATYFAEKRGDNYQRKYKQQESDKDQSSINSKSYRYKAN